jgi:predicted transcriptional regulator
MEAQELRERRKSKGLGQRALAKLSGISQRDISWIDGGRKKASETETKKLSEALK